MKSMPASSSAWYDIQNIHTLDTPALVVFPERVKFNIAQAVAMAGSASRLRPHVKTHKSAEATKLMMEAGIYQFKCATIAEAEMLGICAAPDVLLAYQPTGPKLQRFISVIKKYPGTKYSCLVDNAATALEQSETFEKAGLKVRVYIDLNVGMNRTGIAPGKEAMDLYLYTSALAGIAMVGLHAYDGHLRQPAFEDKKLACDKAFEAVANLRVAIAKEGCPVPDIIAGGSPTFSVHCQRADVQCSPGTFVYWDYGYSTLCPEQPFQPAAVLVTRIISLPTPTRLCLDLGHKSVASENPMDKRVKFLNAGGLTPVGQSEEHLLVEAGENHGYKPGDVLYAMPYHVCPTVALYEKAMTVENGMITGSWRTTARDRSIGC